MALVDYDIELIEKYLDDNLSIEEKKTLDSRLKDSKEFAEEFQQIVAVFKAMKHEKDKQLKSELNTIYQNTKSLKTSSRNNYYLVAAAAVILFICTITYFLSIPNNSNQELYLTHYEVYPAFPNVRGDNTFDNLNVAMEYYRKDKFKQALPIFLNYDADQVKLEQLNLYIANCYLNLDNSEEALNYLIESQSSNDRIIKETSNWYLALAYLKMNKLKLSEELLLRIIENDELFAENASMLIKEID